MAIHLAPGETEAQRVGVAAQGHIAEAALEPRTAPCQSPLPQTQHGPDFCWISLPSPKEFPNEAIMLIFRAGLGQDKKTDFMIQGERRVRVSLEVAWTEGRDGGTMVMTVTIISADHFPFSNHCLASTSVEVCSSLSASGAAVSSSIEQVGTRCGHPKADRMSQGQTCICPCCFFRL